MPEFLSEIPTDFVDKWIVVPFPQGHIINCALAQL